MSVYDMVLRFKKDFPGTIAFRTRRHSEIIEKHLNPGEKVLYAFCGQKNTQSYMIINSCVVALTNKRIMIGQKRVLWGYFFTTITPDLYSDLKVRKGLIWSDVEIDTIHENVYLSNIHPDGAVEIETVITEFMMKEKKKYREPIERVKEKSNAKKFKDN
jgi:hypothetical protein